MGLGTDVLNDITWGHCLRFLGMSAGDFFLYHKGQIYGHCHQARSASVGLARQGVVS
jgi:hypothetical protein